MKQSYPILEKCRIIFFDLEFYVPLDGRNRRGFCYNPWNVNHKFLGGTFLNINPKKDFDKSLKNIEDSLKSFWIWNYSSEEEMVKDIFNFLKITHELVLTANDWRFSPILCGINITSSDYLILFELLKKHSILNNENAFYFQNDFRIIDISQISVSIFNNNSNFLYPKTKNNIFQKYNIADKMSSGKTVWDLYDSKETLLIEERVKSEVLYTYIAYQKLLLNFKNFKILEDNEKKLLHKQNDSI